MREWLSVVGHTGKRQKVGRELGNCFYGCNGENTRRRADNKATSYHNRNDAGGELVN